MSLKTDYKDDMFSGKRKYQVTNNDDGTISLDDVTTYHQQGDVFSSYDINTTNTAVNQNADGLSDEISTRAQQIAAEQSTRAQQINAVKATRNVTFPASGWSASAPYSQTVSVSGITSGDSPIISLYISNNTDAATAKAAKKAYGNVDGGTTGNGTVTLYCYNGKPSANFSVSIKGV